MPFIYGKTSTGGGGSGGSNGNGIRDITFSEDGVITITLDDGTTYTSPALKGEDGCEWHSGTGITGEEMAARTYPQSGVEEAQEGDYYLNTETGNVYGCVTGGDAESATWAYILCVKSGGFEALTTEEIDEIFMEG